MTTTNDNNNDSDSHGDNDNDIIRHFNRNGQGHVFAFLPELAPAARARLLAQAAEIDLAQLARLAAALPRPSAPAAGAPAGAPAVPAALPCPAAPEPRQAGRLPYPAPAPATAAVPRD
ncbi:MAG: hypothetical protein LBC18_11655, partial [Opitutaceae bacterium]|nr:hypothetical protein [Opitutaceae bacterium]